MAAFFQKTSVNDEIHCLMTRVRVHPAFSQESLQGRLGSHFGSDLRSFEEILGEFSSKERNDVVGS